MSEEYLKEEIERLKERQLYLSEQLWFYKYKCRMMKMSQANKGEQDQEKVVVQVRAGSAWNKTYELTVDQKIISLKMLISRDLPRISDSCQVLKLVDGAETILQDVLTFKDYLIDGGCEIKLEIIDFDFAVGDKTFKVPHGSQTIAEFKLLQKIEGCIVRTSDGILVEQSTVIADMIVGPPLDIRAHQVEVSGTKYGVNGKLDVELLRKIVPSLFIPANIEHLLVHQNSLTLKPLEWCIKLDGHDPPKSISPDLKPPVLREMFHVPANTDLEIYDDKLQKYKIWSEGQTLAEWLGASTFQSKHTFKCRKSKYQEMLFNGEVLKRLKFSEDATTEQLEELTKGFYFADKKTNVIRKKNWNKLQECKLVWGKIVILSFEGKELIQLGLDDGTELKTVEQLCLDLDPLMFNPLKEQLVLENGFENVSCSTQTVRELWNLLDLTGSNEKLKEDSLSEEQLVQLLELLQLSRTNSSKPIPFEKKLLFEVVFRVHKVLDVVVLTELEPYKRFFYHSETTIKDLKQFIVGKEMLKHAGFRKLLCKKSRDKKGFLNLERFFDCELLSDFKLDQEGYDCVYFLLEEIHGPEEMGELTYHQTYVVDYDKLKPEMGAVNGILKRFKTMKHEFPAHH